MSQLVLVLVLDAVDTVSSVQLRAEQLVGLDKSIQFLAQVSILRLEHTSVSLQSLALMKEVVVKAAVLLVAMTLGVNVTSCLVQVGLEILQGTLAVTDVVAQVGVTSLRHLQLLSDVVCLSGQTVVISHQASVVTGNLGIAITGAGELSGSLVKLASLCM